MKGFGIVMSIVLLSACGSDKQADSTQSTPDSNAIKTDVGSSATGRFKATLGETSYDLEVNCVSLAEDYFSFLSDKTDFRDSNGDGLIVSGMQSGTGLTLTITDQSESWSAPNLATWKKSSAGITGSGKLYQESDSSTHQLTFEVVCP